MMDEAPGLRSPGLLAPSDGGAENLPHADQSPLHRHGAGTTAGGQRQKAQGRFTPDEAVGENRARPRHEPSPSARSGVGANQVDPPPSRANFKAHRRGLNATSSGGETGPRTHHRRTSGAERRQN